MNDNMNPVEMVSGIIIHAILLGVILFVALPVKSSLDWLAHKAYNKIRNISKKEVKTEYEGQE